MNMLDLEDKKNENEYFYKKKHSLFLFLLSLYLLNLHPRSRYSKNIIFNVFIYFFLYIWTYKTIPAAMLGILLSDFISVPAVWKQIIYPSKKKYKNKFKSEQEHRIKYSAGGSLLRGVIISKRLQGPYTRKIWL